MPIYSYKCSSCGEAYDAMKSFSDSDKDDVCPKCGAPAKRQISGPAGVIYKGSGYYCTDNPHAAGCGCAGCKGGK